MKHMLDTLAKIADEGGPLIAVTYSLFGGNPGFPTAVGLRFPTVFAVFRAVEADDTLAASLSPSLPGPDEHSVDATDSTPWSECVGFGVGWAWSLTNQQGYRDGVRLEFHNPDKASVVVELIVVASAIQIFVAARKG